MAKIYTLDPMVDGRWDALVASHPRASVFHHTSWLRALARTYGYRPVVLTSTPPGEQLSDGIVFCEIKSWITGSRFVSLPFADHSEPLLNDNGDNFDLTSWMRSKSQQHHWKYVELRPLSRDAQPEDPLVASESYWMHTLNLAPSLEEIFHNCHKNCIQRRVRRAEREQLSYEKGCSDELLDDFYRLLMKTRRRHQILPQPRAWFQNLIACASPNIDIRLARKGGIPIAAILTMRHRNKVVYKYGCSDERFHHLAGMPLLFWKLIEEGKATGAEEIDFGRTALGNDGLIKFKDRLGATRRLITYFRFPPNAAVSAPPASAPSRSQRLFSILPDALSSRVGQLAYRHIG